MRKLYSENQIRKLAGESSKKLYRHSITITFNSNGLYYTRFDLISAKSDQYTKTTLPNDASQIGHHAAFGQSNWPGVVGVLWTLTEVVIDYLAIVDSAIKTQELGLKWTDVLGLSDVVVEL